MGPAISGVRRDRPPRYFGKGLGVYKHPPLHDRLGRDVLTLTGHKDPSSISYYIHGIAYVGFVRIPEGVDRNENEVDEFREFRRRLGCAYHLLTRGGVSMQSFGAR